MRETDVNKRYFAKREIHQKTTTLDNECLGKQIFLLLEIVAVFSPSTIDFPSVDTFESAVFTPSMFFLS